MSERQSSGLVKKGKFVRRLMEIMGEHARLDARSIWSAGKGEIGPNMEYVQVNLDKLVASGELNLFNGEYSLPAGSEWIGKKAEPVAAVAAAVAEAPQVQSGAGQATYEPTQQTVTIVKGEKLPRNSKMETFLGVCYLQDVPNWKEAVEYYSSIHGVKWAIVNHESGRLKLGGERLTFE